MPVASSDFPTSLSTSHEALFERDFNAALANQGYLAFTNKITVKKAITQFDWFGTTPRMQDTSHGPGLVLDSLNPFNFQIEVHEFKAALEIHRSALEDDDLGLIQPRISQLAQEAASHQAELILDLFATPGNAFDGTGFFADTRTIGDSANIDNQLSLNTAAPVPIVTEIQEGVRAADAQMMKFQDDKGRVMGLRPNLYVVPPEIAQVTWQALAVGTAPIVGGTPTGSSAMPVTANGVIPLGGGRSMFINKRLTDVNDFYAVFTGGATKPFILAERVRPTLESLRNGSDIWTLESKTVEVVRGRYYRGVGDPRHAIKIIPTS